MSFSYVTGTALAVLLRCFCVFMMSIKASRTIHNDMINKVMKAPINLFFDVTPVGTIMNRFSKELVVIDE
jgi:ABC-type multidrug transport system fused ATPase/permease subunit